MFDEEQHSVAVDAKTFYPDFKIMYPTDEEVRGSCMAFALDGSAVDL